MSDFFGSGQPRVLNTAGRNLDNVIFQYRVPPLSSEWNLINQVGNQKAQDALKVSTPSGWVATEMIQDLDVDLVANGRTESEALSGQILTSINYTENTFKLISKDSSNIAIVNGWPIAVRGTSSPDENNIIELDPPTGDSYRYDFVFLEVWRKLVSYSDPLYPYGNVDTTPYSDNEIIYDVIGVETTKRVQIQYRIRSQKLYTIDPGSDGFDMTSIYPIGGRTSKYEFASYKFRAAGPSDAGLFISGSGTSDDETILNTVDGFVYAIPMFVVYRRMDRPFKDGYLHGSDITRSDVLNGCRSDRVDGKFKDVVNKDDIVDLRHKVAASDSICMIAERTFRKIVSGELRSIVGKGFTDFNAGKKVFPGGSKLMKVDQLNGTGVDFPNIGDGENSNSAWKRRAYSNGALSQKNNLSRISPSDLTPVVTTWAAGTYNVGSLVPVVSIGTISNTRFFTWPLGIISNVSYSYSLGAYNLIVGTGSNLIGTTQALYIQFDFDYVASNSGFLDAPKKMLEYNKNPEVPYALSDTEVYLRENLTGEILCFDVYGKDTGDTETDQNDRVRYAGSPYGTTFDFGMELLLHRTLLGSNQYTFTTPSGKLYGYYILGIKKVEEKVGSNYVVRSFTFSRNATITEYTIDISGVSSTTSEVRVSLYIGSKPNVDSGGSEVYSDTDSIKFFSTNKQARGITEIYELIEAVAYRDSGDIFILQNVDKPFIKLASKIDLSSDVEGNYEISTAYAYDNAGTLFTNLLVYLQTDPVNELLPVLDSSMFSTSLLPNKLRLQVTGVVGDYIKVPVYVHSYVTLNESVYNFYYDLIPYQGILSSTSEIKGKFENENKAVVSSLGSGLVNDWKYTLGKARFYSSRFVEPITAFGDTPDWTTYVQPSETSVYYIRETNSSYYYKISGLGTTLAHTGWIVLAEPIFNTVSASSVTYEIVRFDLPPEGLSNVIDRLPTYLIQDYTGACEPIVYNGGNSTTTITDVLPTVRVNDPIDSVPGDFQLGLSTNPDNLISRGVSDVILTNSSNDAFKISPVRPAVKYPSVSGTPIYKKVYQSYVFFKIEADFTTGRLYLAVFSSEGNNNSTTVELNNFTNKGCVDLFELEGRPIVK